MPSIFSVGSTNAGAPANATVTRNRPGAGQPGQYFAEIGAWIRIGREPFPEPRAALFLDRDGVIIEDKNYLHRLEEMTLIGGAAELISEANRRGVPVVEVTNQAGIGRGYFGWPEFTAIESALTAQLAAAGATIDAVLACPFHENGVAPWKHVDHPARKPRPGMLIDAARILNLDLGRSWIVGDKLADLLAGSNAGLRGGLHVLTGHGPGHRPDVLNQTWPSGFELRLGTSIAEAGSLVELLAPGPRTAI